MMHRSFISLCCALLVTVTLGCDDDGPSGPDEVGLEVTPLFRGVPETDTIRLSASLNGEPVAVTWESSNETVATVTDDGLVTALVPGFAAITATAPNQAKRSASITVVAVTALTSGTGVTVSGSGARGSQSFRKIEVPAGTTNLTVSTSGGTGDVDMYVRHGAVPTPGTFDCRPYEAGNDETCSFDDPTPGTWFIMLELWDPYAGVTLEATVTP